MVGISVTKATESFGVFCLKINKSILERRKNLLTDAKFWKKAKAVL